MDQDKQNLIRKIADSMPSKLKRNMVEKKVEFDNRDNAKAFVGILKKRGGDHNREQAKYIDQKIKEGAFHHESTVVNKEKDKDRRGYIDTKMEKEGLIAGKKEMQDYKLFTKKIKGK